MSAKIMGGVFEHGPEAPADRLFLLAVADHADDDGVAWPGMERLAIKCCVTVRSAQRTLGRLKAAGWVSVIEGGGTRGRRDIGIPNRFQLNVDWLLHGRPDDEGDAHVGVDDPAAVNPDVSDVNPDAHDVNPDVDVAPTPTPTSGEPSVEPPQEPSVEPPGPSVEQQFARWYADYPRKVGRGQAEKAYRAALKKGATPEEIHAGLMRLLPQMMGTMARDVKYVPHPSTWLNGQRWLDDVEGPARSPESAAYMEDFRNDWANA